MIAAMAGVEPAAEGEAHPHTPGFAWRFHRDHADHADRADPADLAAHPDDRADRDDSAARARVEAGR